MDSNHPTPPPRERGQSNTPPLEGEEWNRRLWIGFGKFIDLIKPWLNEVGIIVFGSLIAFNLVVLSSLFGIGPVDPAVEVATAAFAFALPLQVTGILLLRFNREDSEVKFEDRLVQAFHEAGFDSEQIPAPASLQEMRNARAVHALRLSLAILASSVFLVLIGVTATLWHMAIWIAIGFIVMVIICIVIMIASIASSTPRARETKDPTSKK